MVKLLNFSVGLLMIFGASCMSFYFDFVVVKKGRDLNLVAGEVPEGFTILIKRI